jgi:dihydrofolate reductase
MIGNSKITENEKSNHTITAAVIDRTPMRKVIVSVNLTLDGYMAGANGELDWHFPFWTEEMEEYVFRQLQSVDTLLMGRRTYQRMAAHCLAARGDCFADMMNNYNKIVFSTSIKKAAWPHTRFVANNIAEEITRLKQQPGGDMVVYGSSSIIQAFRRMDLVDEYHVWLHPVLIGSGLPLFGHDSDMLSLRLLKTKLFYSGVMLLYYEPARDMKYC